MPQPGNQIGGQLGPKRRGHFRRNRRLILEPDEIGFSLSHFAKLLIYDAIYQQYKMSSDLYVLKSYIYKIK